MGDPFGQSLYSMVTTLIVAAMEDWREHCGGGGIILIGGPRWPQPEIK